MRQTLGFVKEQVGHFTCCSFKICPKNGLFSELRRIQMTKLFFYNSLVNIPLASGQTAALWMLSRLSFGAPRKVRNFSGSLKETSLLTLIRSITRSCSSSLEDGS